MATNNVKFIRLRRGISIDRLVEITTLPKTTLHRIENSKSTKLLNKYRALLAKALTCKPEELDGDSLNDGVQIIGEVKHKCYVKLIPEGKQREAEFVAGMPETACAIRIATPALVPVHFRNDILYFDDKAAQTPKHFLDKQCYVELEKGSRLIVWVTIGSKPNQYMLHHYGTSQIMIDQKIKKAHPIIHIKRG